MNPIPVKVFYKEEIKPTKEQRQRIIDEGLWVPKEKQSFFNMLMFGPNNLFVRSTKMKLGVLVSFITKSCYTYGVILFTDGHFEEHPMYNIIQY